MEKNLSDDPHPSLAVRDRLLAYLYQLDVGAGESLEIALKTLESPGAAALGPAIEKLLALLKERGPSPLEAAALDAAAAHITPPLTRQHMISEGLNISIADSLARVVAGGFRPVKNEDNDTKDNT